MTTNKRQVNGIAAQSAATKKLKGNAGGGVVAITHYGEHKAGTSGTLDEYVPRDSGDEQEPCTQGRPTRASGDLKQRLLDEQVSFIILTRDNNKPSPYGATSTETRPLSWPAVSKLYNAKFGMNVGSAAMEKRARKHRGAWMAARPSYPRHIVYAQNVRAAVPGEMIEVQKPAVPRETKVPKLTVPREMKAVRHIAEMISHQDDSDENDESDAEVTEPIPEVLESDIGLESTYRSLHVGGWVPPDTVRRAADINNYIKP
jgi:hypothetical protein